MIAPTAGGPNIEVHDIVQANPERSKWGPCFVVVTEVKAWGIQGYSTAPMSEGAAYIRLSWDDIEPTGGRAVWVAG